MLNNRIPPPVYFVVAAAVIKLLDRSAFALPVTIPYAAVIAGLLAISSALVVASAIVSFNRAGTTVDPLNPSDASSLVRAGIFRITRNPMYVGLTTLLMAGAVYWQTLSGFLVAALFVIVITEVQIKPEEKALLQLFGADYADYCREVRRWL